jgi:hypothetical protein
MRLISWNCQGAFRKKVEVILNYRPDILIVPKSEHPDKLILSGTNLRPNCFHWHGDNIHKGLSDNFLFSIEIPNPKSQIPNPKSEIRNRKFFQLTVLAFWIDITVHYWALFVTFAHAPGHPNY